ncbi:hypothetical protein DYB32_000007 [Aphanomyces invadans]|uniref:Uncharacterized protein n=1 Tax=Aphanomyces invadans TaxID=157072 RepID=A0A3R6ZBQ3_9STRA|nr:hypothetical protein DYB32_000007 [Aphanomyces invadans]
MTTVALFCLLGAQEEGRAYVPAAGFNNMFKARDALVSLLSSGYRFVDLLDRVSAVDPEIRIRFTSPHPKDFPDSVLQLVNERANICKSIHMPVQHGHSDVRSTKLRRLAEVIDTYNTVVTAKNKAVDEGRLHVVLVQGPSRRSELKLTGLTDTSKRCVFPGELPILAHVPVAPEASMVWNPATLDFDAASNNSMGPTVSLQKGDYVLVRVHEAGRHTLHATPLARTTLTELQNLAPAGLLGYVILKAAHVGHDDVRIGHDDMIWLRSFSDPSIATRS